MQPDWIDVVLPVVGITAIVMVFVVCVVEGYRAMRGRNDKED